MEHVPTVLKTEGRVLATLEADGSRRWLFPRLSAGVFLKNRRWTAYALIAVFTGIPFVHVGGKPLILLDVVRREFTLVGYTFLPRDTFLLALLMLSYVLSIFLFTALFGRVWCGWACPQTVYMEHVYRPIERLFMGRAGVGGRPKADVALWRYVPMYGAFLLVSLYLAHTFLSYFVGVDQLRHWILGNPIDHPWAFFVIAMVTGGMMFDFTYFREQTCLIACPYGRFQSVLLDRNSLIIRYDLARGEPRGKGKKTTALSIVNDVAKRTSGDCIDCTMCVQTCPTGIDIRDGLQFECIGCAQCIDACDAVMEKVGKPKGLIRYSSQNGMEKKPTRIIRPRVVLYSVVITVLLTFLTILIVTKSPVDVLLVRNQGLPFVISPEGLAENTMRLQITNRSDKPEVYRISLVGKAADDVKISEALDNVTLTPGEVIQKTVHLLADPKIFEDGKHVITLRVTASNGVYLDRPCLLFGPADESHRKD